MSSALRAITLYLFVRQSRQESRYSYGHGKSRKTGQQLFGFPDAKSNPRESYRVRYPLTVSLLAKARCREEGKWNKFQVGRATSWLGTEQRSST
jgi:hypothetical protein